MGRGRGNRAAYRKNGKIDTRDWFNGLEVEERNSGFNERDTVPEEEKGEESLDQHEGNPYEDFDADDGISRECLIQRLNPTTTSEKEVFEEGEFLITAN